MKSAKFLILFAFLLAFALQASAQDEKPIIVWKNLQEKYESFKDIKPIIENQAETSIFLARIYPLWSARLIGFNEENQKWENKGGMIRICYTVEDLTIPIEIKSQENRNVSISWETISAYQELLADKSAHSPKIRKYKLIISYALEPWTREQKPKRTYNAVSPKFEVIEKDFKK